MKRIGLLILMTAFHGHANAQDAKLVTAPAVGADTTTGTGGNLFTYGRMMTVEGAKLETSTKAGAWLMEADFDAGTTLVPTSSKAKFKACVPYEGTLNPNGPCFLDDDGDGRFDRHAEDMVAGARKLKVPVSYSKQAVSIIQTDSLRYVILYQGATADTLRFSYREFRDNLARPAFTEDLSVPRESFPQMAILKNIQLEILGVSGMGIRYRIVKVGGL